MIDPVIRGAVAHAVEALRAGGLVVFPTETIYGLGCDALNHQAVARLFEAKRRAPDNPPPVLVGDQAQLDTLVASVPAEATELMRRHWPGALTLILPAAQGLPAALCGNSDNGQASVAVRLPAHPVALALCAQAECPVVATSANFSGAVGPAGAPGTLSQVPMELRQLVQAVVDGGGVSGVASTIVDCTTLPFRVVRQGAVELEKCR